jgi:murein peptide amidase A
MKVQALAVIALAATVVGCGDGSAHTTRPQAPRASRQEPAARQSPRLVHRSQLIGRSVLGRAIRVVESGNLAARRSILVVGCIHGTETAGVAVTRRLIEERPSASAHLWIVNYLNPDGAAGGARVNARGVDLNRNFPWRWRPIGKRGDLQYSGPRPVSEPETRIAIRLIEHIRPTVTVWFHQPVDIVRAFGHSVPVARRFARHVGLPFKLLPWLSGSASNWQNHRFRGAASFVVELPPGALSRAAVARYARAIRSVVG